MSRIVALPWLTLAAKSRPRTGRSRTRKQTPGKLSLPVLACWFRGSRLRRANKGRRGVSYSHRRPRSQCNSRVSPTRHARRSDEGRHAVVPCRAPRWAGAPEPGSRSRRGIPRHHPRRGMNENRGSCPPLSGGGCCCRGRDCSCARSLDRNHGAYSWSRDARPAPAPGQLDAILSGVKGISQHLEQQLDANLTTADWALRAATAALLDQLEVPEAVGLGSAITDLHQVKNQALGWLTKWEQVAEAIQKGRRSRLRRFPQ